MAAKTNFAHAEGKFTRMKRSHQTFGEILAGPDGLGAAIGNIDGHGPGGLAAGGSDRGANFAVESFLDESGQTAPPGSE